MVIDSDGIVIAWNKSIEDMTGIKAEDMLGKGNYEYALPFYGIRRPILIDLVLQPKQEVIKEYKSIKWQGNVLIGEANIRDLRGSAAYLFGTASPLYDTKGTIVGAIECIRDITERKQAEEAMRGILLSVPHALFGVEQRRIFFANEAMEAVFGWKPEELIGKSTRVIFRTDEEWLEYGTILYSRLAKEPVVVFEWGIPFVRKDGSEFFCRMSVSRTGAELGENKRIVATFEDITERKRVQEALRRSEANYRSFIENSQDVFYRSDVQGNLIMASPSLLNLLGYESLDDCLGRPIGESYYYDPEKRTELIRELQAKGRVANYEVVLKRRDGTPVTVETNSHFYLDDTGNIAGIEGVFRDITERKRAEEDRKKLENQLIQAQKMEAIGTLAGGIAHDFNNILSGIMGYSELSLKAVQDRPKVHQNIEQVLKAAERAKELVQQILAFSRKAAQEKKPIALAPIVKEVIRFMRASLPTTIEITTKIEEVADVILADSTQMHQVLINLCTNAGYAMKETGGVLEIGLEEVMINADDRLHGQPIRHGHYLVLTVRDTGQGIPQKNIERIFEPYFTTKEKGAGTGLGLAVVHGIVKDHGGEIRVYSEVGKGTIFSIYLPLMEKQTKSDKEVDEVVLRGKGETILFIDDEKMVVELSREMLEGLGYRVVTETDPLKAIETFKEGRDTFDLVITDKTMPHLTGFDVVREIRMIRTDIPVVLCSGFQDKEDMDKLKELGINQLIAKPTRMSVLAKAIRDELDKDKFEIQKT